MPSDLAGAAELFGSRGYEPLWESWVLALPPGTALPERTLPGLDVRPARDDEQPLVHDIIETAFGEWENRRSRSFEEWRSQVVERPDFDPSLLRIAVLDGVGVGAAFGIHYTGEGWVDQVAVRAEQRGKGIATALLASLFAEFRSRGEQRLRLNTDSRTGALDLYLKLGMVVDRSFTRWSRVLVP